MIFLYFERYTPNLWSLVNDTIPRRQNKTTIVTEDPLSKGKTQDFFLLMLGRNYINENIVLGVEIFLN